LAAPDFGTGHDRSMIRWTHWWSAARVGGSLGVKALPAGVIFVVGLLVGVTLAPVMASRGEGSHAADDPSMMRQVEQAAPVRFAHVAEVLRVVDGDTFDARVQVWPSVAVTTRVRLRGIDAPELEARCAEERTKAEAARDALRAILDQGEVRLARVAHDKYGGRVLADVSTRATPDVSASMIESGAARRYGGARRAGWCQ
jgi:endonuclease YncB( thermonuclease family)